MCRVFYNLAKIMSLSIFSALPATTVSLAICMYDIEGVCSNKFFSKINQVHIIIFECLFPFSLLKLLIQSFFSSICRVYFALYFGRLSCVLLPLIQLIEYHLCYDSNWPQYPLDLQKYFILMIARSQQPIDFNGLGIIHCNLEVFGNVSILLIFSIHKYFLFNLIQIFFIFYFIKLVLITEFYSHTVNFEILFVLH